MASAKVSLGSLLDYLQPQPYIVHSEHYSDDFKTAVLTAGKTFILGRTDEQDGIYQASPDKPIILFDDFTTACQWVDFPFKVKSSACKILVPKPGVNPKYVFYAMKAINFDATSHKRYWIGTYSSEEIKVPERAEQDKIAFELVSIQTAILKKQSEMRSCDELVKSRFNEMFGELIKEPLCNVCDVQMGQSPDSSTYNDEGDGLPFYQGKVDFGDKFIGFNHYCSSPIRVAEASDILMSVRAPVGPVNMTDHECCIGRGLASIRAKKGKADTAFVFAALDLMKDDLARMGTGSTFKAINRKDIENLPLPSASLDKQVSFGMLSKKIDKLKFSLQKEEELLNELLSLRMHQYFD